MPSGLSSVVKNNSRLDKKGLDELSAKKKTFFKGLTSDQVGIPAELKHINKRRKRNQQGLP